MIDGFFVILALLVMLSAPTSWLYDLWAGEGTERSQQPGAGYVPVLESKLNSGCSDSTCRVRGRSRDRVGYQKGF